MNRSSVPPSTQVDTFFSIMKSLTNDDDDDDDDGDGDERNEKNERTKINKLNFSKVER